MDTNDTPVPFMTPEKRPKRNRRPSVPAFEPPVQAEAQTASVEALIANAVHEPVTITAHEEAPSSAAIAPAPPAPHPEFQEAAPSPAVDSDSSAESAAAEPTIEGSEDMATIASPTETTEATANTAQAMFGDVNGRFKAAFEKSGKMGEEMVEFAKGNVEAVVASARVAAKASESLGQQAAEYGKKQFESSAAAIRGFAAVKSPTELFQLQSDFAKASFDSAVAEASRVSEAMLKLAGDVVQPLSSRYAIAVEKMKASSL